MSLDGERRLDTDRGRTRYGHRRGRHAIVGVHYRRGAEREWLEGRKQPVLVVDGHKKGGFLELRRGREKAQDERSRRVRRAGWEQ